MNKQEFINEIQNRGKINITEMTTNPGHNYWWYFPAGNRVSYIESDVCTVYIRGINEINPPNNVNDIEFYDIPTSSSVETLPDDWLLARIGELPFVVISPSCSIFREHIERLFLTSPTGCDTIFDLNSDGTVDVSDLEILAANWNETWCAEVMSRYNLCLAGKIKVAFDSVPTGATVTVD